MPRVTFYGHTNTYAPDSPEGQRILRILTVIGVCTLLIGIVLNLAYFRIADELVEVEAVITKIRDIGDDRRVYVTYTCNDVRYENVPLSYSSSGMREGNKLTIRIHPGEPDDPVSNGGPIFLFIGIIFLTVTQVGKRIAKKQTAQPTA